MLTMLRFWQVLLYFNMILLAQCASNSENPTHLVVTLSSTNDLNDDDDDYYSDNEPSDSIGSDYDALKYLYVKWVKPSPSPSTTTPPSTHLNPPTSTTSTSQHLKRVPRHPHHVWNDNRVDGDAAFDEVSFILLLLGGKYFVELIKIIVIFVCLTTNLSASLSLSVILCMRLNICQSATLCVGGLKCYDCT